MEFQICHCKILCISQDVFLLQHGEVIAKSWQTPSDTLFCIYRNVWHLAMNRVISLTVSVDFGGSVDFRFSRHEEMIVNSSMRGEVNKALGIWRGRPCRAGPRKSWSKFAWSNSNFEGQGHFLGCGCCGNAPQIFSGIMLGLDQMFSGIFAIRVEIRKPCNEMLKTRTPQPSKPVCQDLALNGIELHRIQSGSSKIGQQMMILYIDDVFLKRWTGQPVPVYSSGLHLCKHASVNLNFAIRKMWHCRCSLSPVDDERSACPSVQGFKVRFHLPHFSRRVSEWQISSVSSDQQHTQCTQAAKKVLEYPILHWNLCLNISVLRTVAVLEDGWAWVFIRCGPALPGGWF